MIQIRDTNISRLQQPVEHDILAGLNWQGNENLLRKNHIWYMIYQDPIELDQGEK